jgi:hypothetical protein
LVGQTGKKSVFEVTSMLKNKPATRILVDGGDPAETLRIKSLIGFVDGQTTNPSLIAKNPEIQRLIASGHKLSSEEEKNEYKKIVQSISPLVGDAGVSIEVFADLHTKAEEMVAQGQEMFSWIPNAYIKYPCTHEGLRAAQMSVKESIRVNITLCFSQEQAESHRDGHRRSEPPGNDPRVRWNWRCRAHVDRRSLHFVDISAHSAACAKVHHLPVDADYTQPPFSERALHRGGYLATFLAQWQNARTRRSPGIHYWP